MPNPQPTRAVTAAEMSTYARDGVVHLRQIYPKPWGDQLATLLDDVFQQSALRNQILGDKLTLGKSKQGASSNMVDLYRETKAREPDTLLALEGDQQAELTGDSWVETDASSWHSGMREHNTSGPLAEIVHQLTGSQQINFYSDQLFFKGAGSRVKTPFHQDKPYFLVDGGEMAVAWVPADVVTRENSAMGYVRGSHLWGRTFRPSDFRTETGTFPEVGGIDMSGLETLTPDTIDPDDLSYFDAEPGDVIVHHWATLHGSSGNTSATRSRRAASVRFALDGCFYFARPSSPEPFRHDIDLESGSPLEASPRFPIVWPMGK